MENLNIRVMHRVGGVQPILQYWLLDADRVNAILRAAEKPGLKSFEALPKTMRDQVIEAEKMAEEADNEGLDWKDVVDARKRPTKKDT